MDSVGLRSGRGRGGGEGRRGFTHLVLGVHLELLQEPELLHGVAQGQRDHLGFERGELVELLARLRVDPGVVVVGGTRGLCLGGVRPIGSSRVVIEAQVALLRVRLDVGHGERAIRIWEPSQIFAPQKDHKQMRTSLASLVLLLASLTPVTGNYGDSPYAHKLFPPRGTRVDPDDPTNQPDRKPKEKLDLKIIDTEKCKPLGFGEGIGPACSDCELMYSYIKDGEDPEGATQALEECRECCFIDRDNDIQYDRCEMLVDRMALMYGQHGGVREFLEDHAQPFLENGRLELKFVNNNEQTNSPEMRFWDGDEEFEEERVHLWLAKDPGWGWETIMKYVDAKTKNGTEADKVRAEYKAGVPKKARRKKKKKKKKPSSDKKKKTGFSSFFGGKDEL